MGGDDHGEAYDEHHAVRHVSEPLDISNWHIFSNYAQRNKHNTPANKNDETVISDDRIVLSWDIALSEAETGDYSAYVVLLIRGEVFYILKVVRGRFPFDALKRKVMEVKQRYGSSTLLIEDSPISRGLIQSLREKSINVTPYKPDTDKRTRVIAQSDLFAGGSVRFPRRAAWLEEFTAELLAFPGRHDDQVDALVQALAWSRSRRGEVSTSVVGGMI